MFDSVRVNDGAVDPDLSLHRILEGITIPNGTTWSPDDRTMYFADSTTQISTPSTSTRLVVA